MHIRDAHHLIVGAGLWGAVLAERIASVRGERVTIIDRRAHSGGNCHSYVDPQTGIECHAYGTHIFHTKKKEVWDYISKMTDFNTYRHKVLTEYRGKVYPMPIGLGTVNAFYGLFLKPFELGDFIRREAAREYREHPANLEEKAVSLVGRPLYEAFIKGYTQKQWNKDPVELPADIITRLPVRSDYSFDYFDDPWQGLPLHGYQRLFDALLRHENITLRLGVEYRDIASSLPEDCRVFYSGAIDEFFDCRLGALEWRGLHFEKEIMPYADYQGTSVVNQADKAVPFTRTHEYRHLHPERGYLGETTGETTVVVREYPRDFVAGAERYYPVNTPVNQKLLGAYQEMARELAPNVCFGGRLGSYRYLDMDAAIAQALDVFEDAFEETFAPPIQGSAQSL